MFTLALTGALVGCRLGRQPNTGAGRPPNILLITVDTLRADHLGCYGYRLPTSPQIDRLAARGTLFTDATVAWPKTWPSIASLLTGVHPRTVGVVYNRRELPEAAPLVSEILKGRGYDTAAVVANVNVGTEFGFHQGFDHFVESWHERLRGARAGTDRQPGWVKEFTNATLVTDQALAWLSGRQRERPFLLWLHYMDPHGPYVPPDAYRKHFEGAHAPRPMPLAKLPEYQVQVDPATREAITDLGFYRAQYDREIRYLDDELGRLLAQVEVLGYDRRSTLIVLTSDHGESLGEHEYYLEHGRFPYQGCARVPLVLVQDGRIPAGRRIERPVSLVDATATLLDLAGIDVPKNFEGHSLARPLLGQGDGPFPEFIFMESGYFARTQLTVRSGRWKLVHVRARPDQRFMTGSEYELYDVVADPEETANRSGERPDVVQRLRTALERWDSGTLPPEGPLGQPRHKPLSPEETEMLRSLGYVQ